MARVQLFYVGGIRSPFAALQTHGVQLLLLVFVAIRVEETARVDFALGCKEKTGGACGRRAGVLGLLDGFAATYNEAGVYVGDPGARIVG
jgi:hypothetical protein